MTRTRLLMVRHGEIGANRARVWHGSTDSALTERGEAQARSIGRLLATTRSGVRAVYASPLRRAFRTAEVIGSALGIAPRIEEGLAEYAIGDWEGESYQTLVRDRGFFGSIERDLDFAPPGGESARRVVERTVGALCGIAERHVDEEVIVVGHGAATAFALAELLESDPLSWQKYHQDNCALSELLLIPPPRRLAELVAFNRTEHLSEVGQDHSGESGER